MFRLSIESWWHQPTFQRCWSQFTRVSTCVGDRLTPPTLIFVGDTELLVYSVLCIVYSVYSVPMYSTLTEYSTLIKIIDCSRKRKLTVYSLNKNKMSQWINGLRLQLHFSMIFLLILNWKCSSILLMILLIIWIC